MLFISRAAKKLRIYSDIWARHKERLNCFRYRLKNANTNKAAKASSKHLFAIKKIKDAKQWDKLPDVLKEIAILREEYPEDSLKELGEKTNPPIGKSGVNHRLSRLVELAETI